VNLVVLCRRGSIELDDRVEASASELVELSGGDEIPDDVRIDVLIEVAELVAETADIRPRQARA
jgi:hypothetical protein